MKTEEIAVSNIKCGGCETTIKNALMNMSGIISAEASKDTGILKVSYETIDRLEIIKKLKEIGYPKK